MIGSFSRQARTYRNRMERICRFWLAVSDTVATFGALVAAYYIRFDLYAVVFPAGALFAPYRATSLASYLPSMFCGTVLELFLLLLFGAYRSHTLLRFRRAFPVIVRSLFAWLVCFSAIALILEFNATLSRVYVFIAIVMLVLLLSLSRLFVQRLFSRLGFTAAFRQRILFVDWTGKTEGIAQAASEDIWHPYEIVGCAPSPTNRFTKQPPTSIPTLGSYTEINLLCDNGLVDIVILADGRRSENDVFLLAKQCERTMVDFMVIPSGFQILLSGLELTTVSGVPLLGVTKLPLDNVVNAALKRAVDTTGAVAGLFLSIPVMVIFMILVYLESPGPVLYRQVRIGRRGQPFEILKIRSMKLDAERESGARWATEKDDRRLKIGAFMRRCNIDELPQFWNVLCGDLSLVGPRPERPELIEKFRDEIPFYNARHNIIPGMTGWAQVNGFRGDTDLNERIRCDIYYIENWTLILDIQIMLMTFVRWKGAY